MLGRRVSLINCVVKMYKSFTGNHGSLSKEDRSENADITNIDLKKYTGYLKSNSREPYDWIVVKFINITQKNSPFHPLKNPVEDISKFANLVEGKSILKNEDVQLLNNIEISTNKFTLSADLHKEKSIPKKIEIPGIFLISETCGIKWCIVLERKS